MRVGDPAGALDTADAVDDEYGHAYHPAAMVVSHLR